MLYIFLSQDSLRELVLRHCLSGALFQKGMSWRVHDTLATVYSDNEEEDNRVQTQVFKGGVVKVNYSFFVCCMRRSPYRGTVDVVVN